MYRWILAVAVCVQLLFSSASIGATPGHLWSARFGDCEHQWVRSIAADASGNVVLTGFFQGTVDFGGGPLVGAGHDDIFVVKFDANGNHLWSKRFGDASQQYGTSVAVDGSGSVIVTGHFQGTVDFGGGPLTSPDAGDIFVVKFDPNGNHLWSKRFGDSGDQTTVGVAVDASGNVIVTGFFWGAVDFGGGWLTNARDSDIFVAKFDPNGNHLWSQSFGDGNYQEGSAVATDTSGNVIVTGGFYGTVDFGGGLLRSGGDSDIFVVKFAPNGSHVWSKRFGDAGYQNGGSVELDASGNAILTGYFEGTADFGGGTLTSAGNSDVLVVKLAPGGNHIWSRCFGDDQVQWAESVAADASGNVILTGHFSGTVDCGGGPLTTAGGTDIFVVQFDANGNHLWSQRFGDWYFQYGTGVAADATGNVILTGSFYSTVDFGGGPLTDACNEQADIFVAKFGFGTVPTLLRGFAAAYTEAGIEIAWVMSEPTTGIDFHVLRKSTTDPAYQELHAPDINEQGSSFTFVDSEYKTGLSYVYRVDASDSKDRWTLFETKAIETPAASLVLHQNVPNPFNPSTTISFVLRERIRAVLAIYDVEGRHVRTLVDEVLGAGLKEATWDGKDAHGNRVSSGVYLYRLEVGNQTITKKLTILK